MKSVRWDEDNASALCFYCHQYFTENPQEHYEWFKARLGEKRFNNLKVRALIKVGMPDIKMLTLYYEQLLHTKN